MQRQTKTRTSLGRLSVLLVIVLTSITQAVPAGASDVDLGEPTTIAELLASPEYRAEHADLARLYQASFNRIPDLPGLIYWIDVWEDGVSLVDIAGYFATSEEFRLTYGGDLTDEQFLRVVYENVLGRNYDQAGFDYWLSELRNGLSRAQVVFWIVAGQEFKAAYPFSPTFPAVETALLQPGDVPADYTERSQGRLDVTEADVLAQDRCVQYGNLHSNVYDTFHGRFDGSAFVLQHVYAYNDVDKARQAVEDHRRLSSECASRDIAYSDGSLLTIRYSRFNDDDFDQNTGDEAMVIKAEFDWRNGPIYHFYLYVVRDRNVVTVTDLTTRNSQPLYLAGRDYAELTSTRMRALLGL